MTELIVLYQFYAGFPFIKPFFRMSCHIQSPLWIRRLLHWLQQHLASWKESGPCCEVFQPSSSVSNLSKLDRTPENFIRIGHKQHLECKLDEPKALKVRHYWVNQWTFWIAIERGSLSRFQKSELSLDPGVFAEKNKHQVPLNKQDLKGSIIREHL